MLVSELGSRKHRMVRSVCVQPQSSWASEICLRQLYYLFEKMRMHSDQTVHACRLACAAFLVAMPPPPKDTSSDICL